MVDPQGLLPDHPRVPKKRGQPCAKSSVRTNRRNDPAACGGWVKAPASRQSRDIDGRRVSSWCSAVVYNHASPDSAALSVPKNGGLAISFDDARRPADRAWAQAAGGDVRRAGSARSYRHVRGQLTGGWCDDRTGST